MDAWKFGSLQSCKWTDKFASLEVSEIVKWPDKFGSLEVYKIVNGLISLEVGKFTKLQMVW